MVATLVYVSPGRRGFVLGGDSHANQVVRSRARYNGENFDVRGAITVQPDTVLIAVE